MDSPAPATKLDAPTPPPRRVLLEFVDATLIPSSSTSPRLRSVRLDLAAGELCLIRSQVGRECLPLAEAALGILTPSGGETRVFGKNWRELPSREQLRTRSRFGRVFCREAWISNINLYENVMLPARHHSSLPDQTIEANATRWSKRFGLEELPRERAALVSAGVRRMAEWTRAFAHSPDILLLESPTRDLPDESIEKLRDAVDESLARGAAVLLQTEEERLWSGWQNSSTRRFRVEGERLCPLESPA